MPSCSKSGKRRGSPALKRFDSRSLASTCRGPYCNATPPENVITDRSNSPVEPAKLFFSSLLEAYSSGIASPLRLCSKSYTAPIWELLQYHNIVAIIETQARATAPVMTIQSVAIEGSSYGPDSEVRR